MKNPIYRDLASMEAALDRSMKALRAEQQRLRAMPPGVALAGLERIEAGLQDALALFDAIRVHADGLQGRIDLLLSLAVEASVSDQLLALAPERARDAETAQLHLALLATRALDRTQPDVFSGGVVEPLLEAQLAKTKKERGE